VSYQYPKSYQPNANYVDKEFFGRDSEFDRVVTLLQNGQNVNLTGLRQIGRTWFMEHFVGIASEDSRTANSLLVPKWLDAAVLRTVSPSEAATTILETIQQAMCDVGWIGNTLAQFGEDPWDSFFDGLEFFASVLSDHCRTMVLLLDEAESILYICRYGEDGESRLSGLYNKLRQVVDSMAEYRLIIATHQPFATVLSDVKTDFPTSFVKVPFAGIDEEDTAKLLKSREEVNEVEYSPQALRRAHELSKGHPFFVRHLGEEIITTSGETEIEPDDVDQAFLMVLETCADYLRTDYMEGTDKYHRRILHKLAEDCDMTQDELGEPIPPELGSVGFRQHYFDLMEMGILISDDKVGKSKPHFANEFLKAYIQRLLGLEYDLPPKQDLGS
jgi:hypothetical protein